jgi:hypothetical protein
MLIPRYHSEFYIMKILDQIALNRLISIITNFVLGILKIFAPKCIDDIDPNIIKPKKKKIFPWRKTDE